MARGWESTSVDDQIASARDRPVTANPEVSFAARDRLQHVANLQMARARILEQLQAACDRRYRAQLEQALADVDDELSRAV